MGFCHPLTITLQQVLPSSKRLDSQALSSLLCDLPTAVAPLYCGMCKLLRYFRPGHVYFVTAVTFQRRPLLVEHVDLLLEAVNRTRNRVEFEINAWVVLPDHVHLIVDPYDNDLSELARRLKLSFANLYNLRHGMKSGIVWQPRFWDHIIRNQTDMNRHVDYVHYNPVKHGLVDNPYIWQHSSFARYVNGGYYAHDWGVKEKLRFDGAFGE